MRRGNSIGLPADTVSEAVCVRLFLYTPKTDFAVGDR